MPSRTRQCGFERGDVGAIGDVTKGAGVYLGPSERATIEAIMAR
jgi:hypothetical protein